MATKRQDATKRKYNKKTIWQQENKTASKTKQLQNRAERHSNNRTKQKQRSSNKKTNGDKKTDQQQNGDKKTK